MLIQHGYGVERDRFSGKILSESNVFSCCHCGNKIHAPTLHHHEYGTCFTCDDGSGRGIKCNRPECQPCSPFFRRLEAAETRAQFRSML